MKTHSRERLEVRNQVPSCSDSSRRKNNSCVYHGNLQRPSKLTDSGQDSERKDGQMGAKEQKEDGVMGREERERCPSVHGCDWISGIR